MIHKLAAFAAIALLVSLTIVGSPPRAYAASGGVIEGHVTVPDGATLTSVNVTLLTTNGLFANNTAPDANTGQYQFADVAAGTYVMVYRYFAGSVPVLSQYSGGGYRFSLAKRIVVTDGSTVQEDATLEKGAVLGLTFSDEFGPTTEAVPASLVSAGGGDDALNPINPIGLSGSPMAGANYTSSPLPPGSYTLIAGDLKWVQSERAVIVGAGTDSDTTIVVSPGSPRLVDVKLELKGIVRGSASVATPAGPVPYSGSVSIIDPTNPNSKQTFATGDGTFEFDGLFDGQYRLSFDGSAAQMTLPTFWPGTHDSTLATNIEVVAGKIVDLGETVIQQGGVLSGRVLQKDTNGASVPAFADVELWKLDSGDGSYALYHQGRTDANGRFEAGVVEAGTYAIWAGPTDVNSTLGAEWYTDARYFADGVDVVVPAGQSVQFTDMVLEDRYFDVSRIAGVNRFETAVEISKQVIPAGQRAPVVYLTNAYNFPDALSAGPAAIRAGGVILSTDPLTLPSVIGNRLAELNPVRVVILGDEKSVSKAVEQAVRARVPGAQIDRLGGASRYATGELIVRDAFAATGAPHAIIATGGNYPDALAAGPAAGLVDAPVILVDGKRGLSAATLTLLRDLHVTDVVIAGGLPSVGAQVEAGLVAELGAANVTRLAGANRYETAVLINDHFFGDSEYAFLTTGQNFADALTGGPLAGSLGAPLYLSSRTCIPGTVADSLWTQNVVGIQLYGSTASLSSDVEDLYLC